MDNSKENSEAIIEAVATLPTHLSLMITIYYMDKTSGRQDHDLEPIPIMQHTHTHGQCTITVSDKFNSIESKTFIEMNQLEIQIK